MSHIIPLILIKQELVKRENRKRRLVETILALSQIPDELLSSPTDIRSLENLINETYEYNKFCELHSSTFIQDLGSGYQHKDIHCISFLSGEDFQSIIGIPLSHFGNLFESLLPVLKKAFPKSPVTLSRDEVSDTCSIRFKLFLCFYRLKTGSSHHLMFKIFGWSISSLQEWHEKVVLICKKHMHRFHAGFLEYMGPGWQNEEVTVWKMKHLFKLKDYSTFLERIDIINADAASKGLAPRIKKNEVEGSLGAYDCTYSLRPRIMPTTLAQNGEDPTADRLYSDYSKAHAYKLLIFTSHGIDSRPKFIMWVEIGPGSIHDNPLLVTASTKLEGILISKAFFRNKSKAPSRSADGVDISENKRMTFGLFFWKVLHRGRGKFQNQEISLDKSLIF
jgi:hypothetical protein